MLSIKNVKVEVENRKQKTTLKASSSRLDWTKKTTKNKNKRGCKIYRIRLIRLFFVIYDTGKIYRIRLVRLFFTIKVSSDRVFLDVVGWLPLSV
jgi:hypothetical protein